MVRTCPKNLLPALCLALSALLLIPAQSDASFLKKISKAAKSVAHEATKTVHETGEVVHDSGVSLGKDVKKTDDTVTKEIISDGKVVGHAVVKDGKVVATETVEAGKVVGTETETGAKFIVSGSQIVGREVVVDGKVVGHEVIKDGKIVGHTVVEGGEYIVKAGTIMYDAVKNCKKLGSMIPMPKLVCKDVTVGARCTEMASIAFGCKIPHVLDGAASIPSLTKKIASESSSSECKKSLIPPLQQICGLGKVLAGDGQKVYECIAAASKAGILKEVMKQRGGGGSPTSDEACSSDGELAFDVTMFELGKAEDPNMIVALSGYLNKIATVDGLQGKLSKIPACSGK